MCFFGLQGAGQRGGRRGRRPTIRGHEDSSCKFCNRMLRRSSRNTQTHLCTVRVDGNKVSQQLGFRTRAPPGPGPSRLPGPGPSRLRVGGGALPAKKCGFCTCTLEAGLRVDSGAARSRKGARAGQRVDRRGSYASSGPGWEIQEVSRVGAQRVTSKPKLLAREMPRVCRRFSPGRSEDGHGGVARRNDSCNPLYPNPPSPQITPPHPNPPFPKL